MSTSATSKTGGQLSDSDQRKRFGRLTGSNCGGLLGLAFKSNEKNENGWGPTASKIFQLQEMDEEQQQYCAEGNRQELVTVDAIRKKPGMPEIIYPCESIEDEEYCFIASTPDALTKEPGEGGFEFKYKSKHPEKPLKKNRDVPYMHKSQCMLNMRVAKRKWWQLYIRNATQLIPYHINPSAEESKNYWNAVLPIYERFYQQCLRWYWERDISQSFVFVELMKAQGHSESKIDATLARIQTARHPPVVNGRFVQGTLSRQPLIQFDGMPCKTPTDALQTEAKGHGGCLDDAPTQILPTQNQALAVPQQPNVSSFSLPTPEPEFSFEETKETSAIPIVQPTPHKNGTTRGEGEGDANGGEQHDEETEGSDQEEDTGNDEHDTQQQRATPVVRNLHETLVSIQVTPPQRPQTWKRKRKSMTPLSVLPSKNAQNHKTSPDANLSTKRGKHNKTTPTTVSTTRKKAGGSTILAASRTTRESTKSKNKKSNTVLDNTDRQIDDWIGDTTELLNELD